MPAPPAAKPSHAPEVLLRCSVSDITKTLVTLRVQAPLTPGRCRSRCRERRHTWLWDAIGEVRPGVTTADIASKWPSAQEIWGYAEEDQAAANLWGHGLGLVQYDRPVISRIWSLDHPEEIRPGMVFALETQHGKNHEFGVRLEEMMLVTDDGHELLSTYNSDGIIVAG
jgi:hypothetical protein